MMKTLTRNTLVSKRILALLMLVITLATMIPFGALAASSVKHSGTDTETFWVYPTAANSTLTVSPSKGKYTGTKLNLFFKQVKTTGSEYASYTVSVDGFKSKTMTSSSVSFKLPGKQAYKVTVKYNGFSNCFDTVWDKSWTKAPSYKVKINKFGSVN